MRSDELDDLEIEFEIRFPTEYRRSLTVAATLESCLAFKTNPESLALTNQLCRRKGPWDFEWEQSFWSIGTDWIGNRNGTFCHFINCDDVECLVYTLTKASPAWTIADKNRLAPVVFDEFFTSVQRDQIELRKREQLELERFKRRLAWRSWRISFRRLPNLKPPPEWMTAELQRRTGLNQPRCVELLTTPTAQECWCALRAGKGGTFEELMSQDDYFKSLLSSHASNMEYDDIEIDDRYAPYLLRADLSARRELHGQLGGMGFCHVLWRTKQRILKDEYGIDWKTPQEMNRHIEFD